MANKQTIQDVDAALDRWHGKLNMSRLYIKAAKDAMKSPFV
ncbi:MAG: hypothetical protein WAV38_35735 [Xanthobacteraceae bacterium]